MENNNTSQQSFDASKLVGKHAFSYDFELTQKDLILYALSIGFSTNPLNTDHFKLTYEGDENFQPFATFSASAANKGFDRYGSIEGMPSIDLTQVLHGEEEVEIIQPLKQDQKYRVEFKILDLQDKGKLSILVFEKSIKEAASGELYSRVVSQVVIRGLGGFGYKGTYQSNVPKKPTRKPDFVGEEKTSPFQAILFRLNGDDNPLHIDPEFAAMAKFEKPIIHGLCTFGFGAKAIYEKYGGSNPASIKKVGGRFTSHVFPGETLIIEMWKDGNIVYYETKTKERGLVAVKGFVEFKDLPKL